jgi:hypothetical protein
VRVAAAQVDGCATPLMKHLVAPGTSPDDRDATRPSGPCSVDHRARQLTNRSEALYPGTGSLPGSWRELLFDRDALAIAGRV